MEDKGSRVDSSSSVCLPNLKTLKEKILSNPSVSAVFGSGFEIYLVGGYVRDIIRGSTSTDLDFVFRGDAGGLISWLSSEIGGKAIEFKKGPLIKVIVDKTTLDFAECKGKLEDDLSARDFTINAIAWSPERGIIDPMKGSRDIERGLIRAISKKNLIEDPLRLLRAYRFAAELGWRIDPSTRCSLKDLKGLLRQSAPERITLELFRLLESENHVKALKAAFIDGILASFLACDSGQLKENVKALSRFHGFLKKIHDRFNFNFDELFSQGLLYIGVLRAELLLFKADIAQCRVALSRKISKRITTTGNLLDNLRRGGGLQRPVLFCLFEEAGDSLMDFALMTGRVRVIEEARRFLSMKKLLSSEEVMSLSGLKGGPELHETLKELKRAQYTGRAISRDDARKFLEKYCKPVNGKT